MAGWAGTGPGSRHQRGRLRELLAHAAANSPFYARRLAGIVWLALLPAALPLLAGWLRRPDGRAVRAIAATPAIFASLSALALLSTAGSSVQYLMPSYMIRHLHASAARTGLTVLAYPLAMGLTAPVGGLLADRWSARRAALAGAALVAAADLLLAQAGNATRPADLSWRLALAGLGMGPFSGPNQTTIMNTAPRHALATAGAAIALTRSLGFALGPALSTLIWAPGGYPATGLKTARLLPSAAAALAGPALGAPSLLSRPRGQNRSRGIRPPRPRRPPRHQPWTAPGRDLRPAAMPSPPGEHHAMQRRIAQRPPERRARLLPRAARRPVDQRHPDTPPRTSGPDPGP